MTQTASVWVYPIDRARMLLLEPGQSYSLRARLLWWWSTAPSLVSNELTVTISDPTEESTARTQLFAQGAIAATNDLIPGFTNPRTSLPRLIDFVNAFPESVYSVYVRRSYVWAARRPIEGSTVDGQIAQEYEAYLQANAPWALTPDARD